MSKEIITKNAPAAIGPYSQAVKAGSFLFVSGQIPVSPIDGVIVDGDIAVQTKRVIENIEAILKEAGADLSDVVKTTVFLTDLSNFEAFNKVYAGFFTEPYPARACVEVSRLPKGALVEIEVIAEI